MSKWNSRKLAAFVALTTLATVLLWLGKIDGGQWVQIVEWVGGFYLAAQAHADRGVRLSQPSSESD